MRYICIDRRRNQYPVMMMCRLLQVSRSGYYAWRVRAESQRAKTDRELIKRIRQIHADSDGVYGAAKIAAELNEQGYPCGRHKVARLMRIAGLKGCPKTTFKVTTQRDLSHPVADNLLEQDFTAEGPNERWASDITYISTHQGWLFLAVVMDLYSRRIVGWSMGRWINRHLVIDALNNKHNIQCSMSARGNCYDNAVVESFFGLLKRERVNRTRYLTRDEAKADVFDYIERFYNRKRRHGYLGNISPAAFEERNQNKFQTVH
jgi:putative transposase